VDVAKPSQQISFAMSFSLLSPWNQPLLVAASGVVAAALLPVLEQRQQFFSVMSLQLAQAAAYSLNVFATAQPGRLDGQMQQEALLNNDTENKNKTMKTDSGDVTMNEETATSPVAVLSTGRRGRTLLAPKGWAFIIWGPIFIGELIHVTTYFLLKEQSSSSSSAVTLLQRTAPGFVMAQIFQSLWAASFRPKYSKGLLSLISFGMLSGIAISLNGPHAAICGHNHTSTLWYLLHGLPLTMHFGWTSAASLVNLNGSLAMMMMQDDDDDNDSKSTNSARLITAVGHGSVVVATTLGVAVTLVRTAPVYGAVICWALVACADGMADRCRSLSQQPSPKYATAARVQKWLCFVGAGIVATASLVATVKRWQH
jgi:hypothetical protein